MKIVVFGYDAIGCACLEVLLEARGDVYSLPAQHGPVLNLTQTTGIAERFFRSIKCEFEISRIGMSGGKTGYSEPHNRNSFRHAMRLSDPFTSW